MENKNLQAFSLSDEILVRGEVLRDHIYIKIKQIFFKYTHVIHRKKRLLSLTDMQKSGQQNIEKWGSYVQKNF